MVALSNLWSHIARLSGTSPPVRWGVSEPALPRDRYALADAYYSSLGLYAASQRAGVANAEWLPALKAIRNVAPRVVEFHASHLWPGTLPDALPIETEYDAIIAPIEQVWEWSNWGARKQVAARWLALYGDLFIKVAAPAESGRVYFQLIKPAYVTDFATDERGFLTSIRLDIPQTEQTGVQTRAVMHTEVWEKGRYRRWVHTHQEGEELHRLGRPREGDDVALPFDFVPFVHAQFRDIGEERGTGAFWGALEKIDEANLEATRLSQMVFRHNAVTWALEGTGQDSSGRPIPPPIIAGYDGSATASTDRVTLGDEEFYRLPSGWTLRQLVPALHYGEALAILQDMMLELEKDLPELAYARITEAGGNDQSGRALRFMLTPAINRALEARGNAEGALMRADQMALTLGTLNGLFPNIGTYEAGDFAHRFKSREVIPITADEHEAQALGRAQRAMIEAAYLPAAEVVATLRPEWDEDQVAEAIEAQRSESPFGGVDEELKRLQAENQRSLLESRQQLIDQRAERPEGRAT